MQIQRLVGRGGCLLLLALVCLAAAGWAQDAATALPAPPGASEDEIVVAYYCHVTFRCETCLAAEQRIEDLLHTDFAERLEAGTLLWHALDYEQPENEAYAAAFGLEGGPAFVLGRWRADRLVEWHDVVEIWGVSDDPIGLVDLARDRVKRFLDTETWRAAMDSTRAAAGTAGAATGTDPERNR